MIIALPTADRRVAHDFYQDGLGLEPVGDPAEDGAPSHCGSVSAAT